MPVQGRGRFPKAPNTFRDDGTKGPLPGRVAIDEYRALNMPRGDEALKLLQSVGVAVKPIMIKHNWRLPLLVEIYPKQQSLLGFNVNAGRKIALRLRHASNHNEFIDQESVTETMLHELAHNLRGPHDEIFFEHLDTLTKEWCELQSTHTGLLPGQIFLSGGGVRLGRDGLARAPQAPPNSFLLRQRAAEMAEKRRQEQGQEKGRGVMPINRLGGSNATAPPSGSDTLSAIRAEAAERRRRITQHCPSGNTHDTVEAAKEQQGQELLHGIQVITITDDADDEREPAQPDRQKPILQGAEGDSTLSDDDDEVIIVDVKRSIKPRKDNAATSTASTTLPNVSSSNSVNQTRAAAALRHGLLAEAAEEGPPRGNFSRSPDAPTDTSITAQSRSWACQRCTLFNRAISLVCQACDEIRPGLDHWICLHCQHRMLGDDAQYWLCPKCGRLKTA